MLFIDEIHRFSKTQQDSLLGAVEDRLVTLVAATTENPFFSSSRPLLSRSLLLTLQPLDDDDVRARPATARSTDERGLGGAVTARPTTPRTHLVRHGRRRRPPRADRAGGRRPAPAVGRPGAAEIDLATLETAVDTAAVRYDRDGDQHYDVISAFIKSIRGSDVDAALHYLARMIEAGEDPRFIARRLVIHASEDIGMADPTALLAAVAAAAGGALIGMPEARINLAQATIHLAMAPEVERGHHGDRRSAGRRARGAGRAGAAAPARRALRRRGEARPRQALRLPARPARRRGRAAVPAGRAGRQGLLPARRTAAPRRAWPSGWPSCGRSSAGPR